MNNIKTGIVEIDELLNEEFSKFEKVLVDIRNLLARRNMAYGDSNLLDAGLIGIVVRMNDKIGRIKNILKEFSTNEITQEDESVIVDALMDIAGYAVNALRLIEEGRMTKYGRFFD
jgi:hypothetical protein